MTDEPCACGHGRDKHLHRRGWCFARVERDRPGHWLCGCLGLSVPVERQPTLLG